MTPHLGTASTPSDGGGAGCRAVGTTPTWFAERPAEVELARSLCRPCPLRADCLAGALARAEPWGVWGGQLLVRGAVVGTKRGRGRPRRSSAAA